MGRAVFSAKRMPFAVLVKASAVASIPFCCFSVVGQLAGHLGSSILVSQGRLGLLSALMCAPDNPGHSITGVQEDGFHVQVNYQASRSSISTFRRQGSEPGPGLR